MDGSRLSHLLRRSALVFALAWFLFLPLRDVIAFPERISVLPNLETDAAAYDAFAWEFAKTKDFASLPSKHPPGWMVLLAGVYATAGHSYVAGKVISWIALILSVALCAWLADRVYGRPAAVIAALLCASSPGLRGYVGTLQYEVLTAALFMLFLVLSARILDAQTRSDALTRAGLAGIAGSALVMTRETFVLAVPITALWLWSQQRRKPAELNSQPAPVLLAALIVIVAAAVPLMWSAAQTQRYGRLILISEKGPKEFQLGNNPLANGTYNEPLVGIGEPAGIEYIREFPLGAMTLAARKVLYSFSILRDGWTVPHPPAVWLWRATTGAVPLQLIEAVVRGGWLLVACGIGLYMLGRQGWRTWWVLPATIGSILMVHIITLASFRFTIPLLPALYVVASGPLAHTTRAAAMALRSPVIAVASVLIAAVVLAAQFQSWPLAVAYDAAGLDGIAASNRLDEQSGKPTRFAEAAQGVRPVVLLPDTSMPRGTLRVTTRMRRTQASAEEATIVARVTVMPLHGIPCTADVLAAQLPSDQFTDITMLCALERDTPTTFAVFSTGAVDLAISQMRIASADIH